MNILMIVTSHDRLGETGRKTGFWLEELAAPYYTFIDSGSRVTLASPKGGRPPMDPGSAESQFETGFTKRFLGDKEAMHMLENTLSLSDVSLDDVDAVFYPGGHGPLWDLAEDMRSIGIIERLYAAGKPVGAVCHGPAALLRAIKPGGTPLVAGHYVTGFTNSEEKAVGLEKVVPFSIEDEMARLGATFEKMEDFAPFVVVDHNLVTGQNPASSEKAAQKLLALIPAATAYSK